MEFISLDGGEGGENSGVGFVEISWIIAMKCAYFFGTILFNRA